MKYLDLYYKFAATGMLENHPTSNYNGGICGALPQRNVRNFCELFRPDEYAHAYWGHPGPYPKGRGQEKATYGFNPLRQNMVLFLAAMNNEL